MPENVKPWTEHRAGLMVEAAGNRLSLSPHRVWPRTGPEHMAAALAHQHGPMVFPSIMAAMVSRAIYEDLMHRHT